jgi:hypothetical protein
MAEERRHSSVRAKNDVWLLRLQRSGARYRTTVQASIRECTLRFAVRRWDTSVFEVDVVNCLAADAANRLISQTSLARPPFALEFEVT